MSLFSHFIFTFFIFIGATQELRAQASAQKVIDIEKRSDSTYESLNFFDSSRLTDHEKEKGISSLHGYSDELVDLIVSPRKDLGEFILQTPVVARGPIEKTLKIVAKENEGKDLTTSYYLKYGLHPEVSNSYWKDRKNSYVKYKSEKFGTQKMGVTPNCYSCHSGRVGGTLVMGLGNQRIDYRTFFKDLNPYGPTKNALSKLSSVPNISHIYKEVITDKKDEVKDIFHEDSALGKGLWSRFWQGTKSFFGVLPELANRTKLLVDMYFFVIDPETVPPTAGRSDPWSIAVQLFNWRDNDMNYHESLKGRKLVQEPVVMDPMPWWLLKYKKSINWDGIISKGPRTIVQAAFSPGNSGQYIRDNEDLFIKIYEEAHRMDSPRYPQEKNNVFGSERKERVIRGETLFNNNCIECHGKHSESGLYFRNPKEFDFPEQTIPTYLIGTDDTRAKRVNLEYIKQLEKSWIGYYGNNESYKEALKVRKEDVPPGALISDTSLKILTSDHGNYSPVGSYYYDRDLNGRGNNFEFNYKSYNEGNSSSRGYLAPPLWGISLSAPYFHNGSVPNLTQLLLIERRSDKWMLEKVNSISVKYDYEKVGVAIRENLKIPQIENNPQVFDTRLSGHKNKGHEFSFTYKRESRDEKEVRDLKMTKQDKLDLLEYLKTL